MPNPEEDCCFNRGVDDTQCTMIVYVDDLHKKYAMTDDRMMVKLDKTFYGCIESAKL